MYKDVVVKLTKHYSSDLNIWAKSNILGLFVFNIVLIVLVLLNTAQYFKPFFYLGINSIFFISLLLSIVLLKVRSKGMFLISIIFFIFGLFLKVSRVDIWADRASIYFYQSFFIGLMLLLAGQDKD